ncbi:MAG: 50S ribosomal protein L30 [Chloroflexi bacterium]|nr:50S ribosomal protein L30 [Chloroflexota bacterium]
MADPKVKITYTKSGIGYSQRQKNTLRALGLRKLGDCVERPLNGPIKGMLVAVEHLVTVEDVKA